jgi:hypothetical protein
LVALLDQILAIESRLAIFYGSHIIWNFWYRDIIYV